MEQGFMTKLQNNKFADFDDNFGCHLFFGGGGNPYSLNYLIETFGMSLQRVV